MRRGKKNKTFSSGAIAQLALSVIIGLSASTLSAKARADKADAPAPSRPKLNVLINMGTRPTIADIEKVLTPWPSQNPFQAEVPAAGLPGGATHLLRLVSVDGPKIIAELEKAFPGGTYAFLGRDSAFLGDVVDAFYRAHGQNNRVIHLNASGGSMVNDNSVLVDFLAGNGLRVESIDQDPPFVIIDRTSYNVNSQSRRYLRAFYEAYAKKTGRPINSLPRKMNVISTAHRNHIQPGFDVAQFLTVQEQAVDQNGPPDIMSIHAASLTDQTEWHQTFGPFVRQNGRVFAPPGRVNSAQNSEAILAILYDVINITRSEQFYRDVQANAKALGYEFPQSRPRERTDLRIMSDEELEKDIVNEAQAKFAKVIDGLDKAGEDKEPLSENGAQLYAQINESGIFNVDMPMLGSAQMALMYVAGTVQAYELKKITSRDLRRIVKRILAFYGRFQAVPGQEEQVWENKNNVAFAKGLAQLYHRDSLTFRQMWDSKAEYFLNTEHKAGKNGPITYRAIDEFIKAKDCAALLAGEQAAS